MRKVPKYLAVAVATNNSDDNQLRAVVLDCTSINGIDATSMRYLKEIFAEFKVMLVMMANNSDHYTDQ